MPDSTRKNRREQNGTNKRTIAAPSPAPIQVAHRGVTKDPDQGDMAVSSLNPGLNFHELLTTGLMGIKELPKDQAAIDKIRAAINAQLFYDFISTRLSAAEQETLRARPDELPSFYRKFDTYLLNVAQQWGARLFLSTLVMLRLWSWQCGEQDGASKLKALFHEIHRSALIQTGEAKGRVTDQHRARKADCVKELTILQMQLREAFPETPDAVRRFVEDIIKRQPGSFPYLNKNLESFLLFLDDPRVMAFRGSDWRRKKGDLTPTRFYEQWVTASLNRTSSEDVRQDLSR